MMWRKFLVLPFILFLAAPAAAATPNAPQLTTAYDAKSVQQFLSVCNRDMSQCDLEISTALLDKLDAPDATSICMTKAKYEEPVVTWLKDHSESWPMPTEDGIYTAFKTLYPC